MPSAEIITIGTELLLGEILDTNTQFIAKEFRNAGIDLFRTTTIGDNPMRISNVIKEANQRATIVITTGGLGPTVDDPTREAVASAINVNTEFHPDLWEQIETRYNKMGRKLTENNKRQAFIPKGAVVIPNPVGTAPAFYVKTQTGIIVSLPGVPSEMEYLLTNSVIPLLKQIFSLSQILKTATIHTSGAPESMIDQLIGDLEELSNPTVGLVAKPGNIDIRVAAKAEHTQAADEMIKDVIQEIEKRLGEIIFGYDETTLPNVVTRLLNQNNLKIVVQETGTHSNLTNLFIEADCYLELPKISYENNLVILAEKLYKQVSPNPVIILQLDEGHGNNKLTLIFGYKNEFEEKKLNFGGHADDAQPWAINMALNFIRTKINYYHNRQEIK